jgi:hypothetical protein
MTKYNIVRFFANNQPSLIVKRNVTLEDAKAHCNDPSTRKPGAYFDGYTEVNVKKGT